MTSALRDLMEREDMQELMSNVSTEMETHSTRPSITLKPKSDKTLQERKTTDQYLSRTQIRVRPVI